MGDFVVVLFFSFSAIGSFGPALSNREQQRVVSQFEGENLMFYLAWIFWAINVAFIANQLYYGKKLSAAGATYMKNPTWWLTGPYGLVGVVSIPLLGWSPWNLIW